MAATAGPVGAAANESAGETPPPVRTKRDRPEAKSRAPGTDDESFAKTARKMWDNPAGKSMMTQGVKIAVGMMYQDFIDGLDLSKDETDYFKDLLGKEMAAQQEIGMKMLGANPEERKTLAEEITQRSKEAEEEIQKFLNSEEDFQQYKDYKSRLPERQQLDGIRATMSAKGLDLAPETEDRLVDAMHQVRTQSKAPDFSGPGALEEMAKGNMVESYEKNWASQQETLSAEVSKILTSEQLAAFQEYQQQAKEMQLMGLKMAEKMMQDNKDGSD